MQRIPIVDNADAPASERAEANHRECRNALRTVSQGDRGDERSARNFFGEPV